MADIDWIDGNLVTEVKALKLLGNKASLVTDKVSSSALLPSENLFGYWRLLSSAAEGNVASLSLLTSDFLSLFAYTVIARKLTFQKSVPKCTRVFSKECGVLILLGSGTRVVECRTRDWKSRW